MKEQIIKEQSESIKKEIDSKRKNFQDSNDEFVDVVDIHTGKVKRMRFTYELRNTKKEK